MSWLFNPGRPCCGGNEETWVTTRRYSESGTLLWNQDHGSIVTSVVCDADGNVYTGGAIAPPDHHVRKYSPSGELLWSVKHGGTNNTVTALAVDSSKLYVASSTVLEAYDLDGNLSWSASTGEYPFGQSAGHALLVDGSSLLVGGTHIYQETGNQQQIIDMTSMSDGDVFTLFFNGKETPSITYYQDDSSDRLSLQICSGFRSIVEFSDASLRHSTDYDFQVSANIFDLTSSVSGMSYVRGVNIVVGGIHSRENVPLFSGSDPRIQIYESVSPTGDRLYNLGIFDVSNGTRQSLHRVSNHSVTDINLTPSGYRFLGGTISSYYAVGLTAFNINGTVFYDYSNNLDLNWFHPKHVDPEWSFYDLDVVPPWSNRNDMSTRSDGYGFVVGGGGPSSGTVDQNKIAYFDSAGTPIFSWGQFAGTPSCCDLRSDELLCVGTSYSNGQLKTTYNLDVSGTGFAVDWSALHGGTVSDIASAGLEVVTGGARVLLE